MAKGEAETRWPLKRDTCQGRVVTVLREHGDNAVGVAGGPGPKRVGEWRGATGAPMARDGRRSLFRFRLSLERMYSLLGEEGDGCPPTELRPDLGVDGVSRHDVHVQGGQIVQSRRLNVLGRPEYAQKERVGSRGKGSLWQ